MEFSEKLQELRKQRGLTQEELAGHLYVSRTAISKWESGRGYPNIDSLKAIAAFFSVSVDALLSTSEALGVAEEERRQREGRLTALAIGLPDLCMAMLLFLPFFAVNAAGAVQSTSLVALTQARAYLRVAYLAAVLVTALTGAVVLALQARPRVLRYGAPLSLGLGAVAVLLFTVSRQPYAAAFAFLLLAIKAFLLLRRR